MDYTVRKPKEEEYPQIVNALLADETENQAIPDECRSNMTEMIQYLKGYFITVLEDYQSDSPSYCGKLITITWGECSFMTRLIAKKTGGLEVEHSWRREARP